MSQSNDILTDFDIILDTDIGVFNVLKFKYNNPNYFNSSLISNIDHEALIYSLLSMKYDNVLDLFIKDEYKNQSSSLYNQIITDNLDDIYNNSLLTDGFDLFKVYLQTGVINITVLCKNEKEEQIIKKLDKNFRILRYSEDKKISCDGFDTIFLKKYKDVDRFEKIDSKNIFIYNYANNLDETNVPLLEVSVKVALSNKVYTIDLHKIQNPLG